MIINLKEKVSGVFNENMKSEIKKKIQNVGTFIEQNKELIALGLPIVCAGGMAIIKFAAKSHNLNKQKALKDNFCYDRSLGHYWELKRKLTTQEWVTIDKRRARGERLADILRELKVLK